MQDCRLDPSRSLADRNLHRSKPGFGMVYMPCHFGILDMQRRLALCLQGGSNMADSTPHCSIAGHMCTAQIDWNLHQTGSRADSSGNMHVGCTVRTECSSAHRGLCCSMFLEIAVLGMQRSGCLTSRILGRFLNLGNPAGNMQTKGSFPSCIQGSMLDPDSADMDMHLSGRL